jgi:Ni/Co efflux regulator RcnB
MIMMSSLTSNKTALLSLLIVGVALASYALPIAAFAQNGGEDGKPKWNDKHWPQHNWDKESKSYKDDSGNEYKCETFHDGSYYYFYKGEFYKCDDYKPSSPSETPY